MLERIARELTGLTADTLPDTLPPLYSARAGFEQKVEMLDDFASSLRLVLRTYHIDHERLNQAVAASTAPRAHGLELVTGLGEHAFSISHATNR